MKMIAIAAALALPAAVFANLGDTESAVASSYGAPTSERKVSDAITERAYACGDMAITVSFINGISQCEKFALKSGAVMDGAGVEKILKANSNNLRWTERTAPGGQRREWVIAGPAPDSAATASQRSQAVLAVSEPHRSAEGGARMVAVGALNPDAGASSAPLAPPVLRRAVLAPESSGAALTVFTAAFEKLSGGTLATGASGPAVGK